jgi:hypothetical protein
MRLLRPAAMSAAALASVASQPAAAHAFGQRYDLPLPLGYFLVGGAAVVLLSFVVAAVVLRPSSDRAWQWPLPRLPQRARAIVEGALAALGLYLFLLILAAGWFGIQEPTENIAPVLVWVLWWVGFLLATALVGNLWPHLDPWRTLWRSARRLLGRARPAPIDGPAPWGAWPAVAMYFVFAWLELASSFGELPRDLVLIILLYSAGAWAGMASFGAARWRAGADPFSRVFGLFGRFAPLGRNAEGRLVLRLPGAGLLGEAPRSMGEIAFVLLVLATVTFDGFAETPPWNAAVIWLAQNDALRPLLAWLGDAANVDILMAAKTLGLLLAALLFFTVFAIVCRLSALVGGGVSGREAMRAFAHSFLPIAIAYHAAHYLSYLLLAGQLAIPLASDPFGWGWDLFGTRDHEMDLGLISMKTVWTIAVVAIVAGHVISVTLAHVEALRLFPTRRAALLSQLPMLALMVAFTSASLWIMSQPIVELD